MPGRFTDKVVIVTGSSAGIGRETAKMFAEDGAKLTITGRNAQALDETKTICVQAGAKAEYIVSVIGNIQEDAVHKKIIEETVNKFGRIDILINNAGAAGADNNQNLGFSGSVEDFDYTINVNLRSVLAITKLALPYLEKTKGNIVMVSSIASTSASTTFPYYSVAKAGLDHLTRALALSSIEKGVRVNCVNPGVTSTKFMEKIGMSQTHQDTVIERMSQDRGQIPIGRPAHPKEIAELIVFLSDNSKSEYIVGQCIIIDGGRSLCRPTLNLKP